MKIARLAMFTLTFSLVILFHVVALTAQTEKSVEKSADDWPVVELEALKKQGAFGFPSQHATTFCDDPSLRLQAWCDQDTLVVQAVLWTDGDNTLGETKDGRSIGDRSTLVLDVDLNGASTAKIDRKYSLDPWPSRPGLRYSIPFERGSSYLKGDSTGRGSIRYFSLADSEKNVRVDTFAIPLAELELEPNDTLGLAYHGSSSSPSLTVNSIGFESDKQVYYAFSLPFKDFHHFKLAEMDGEMDLQRIPAGREDEPERQAAKPQPEIGSTPPELQASGWLNTDDAPTLASFKGKVVLLDFWATWCGPCVAGIPHLNELQKKHADDGLQVLSFTDQSQQGIENFQQSAKNKIQYPAAVGSNLHTEYGVVGFPTAFVIGRDGKVLWSGNPSSDREKMDAIILEALDK